MPARRDRVLAVLALLIWVLPMTWVIATRQPAPCYGRALNNLYGLTCLFPRAVHAWPSYYIQVRREGAADWEEIPVERYFQLQPFGLRTRLHRILDDARSDPRGRAQMHDVAGWLAEQERERNPALPPVQALRFLAYTRLAGWELIDEMRPWWRRPLDELLPVGGRLSVLSEVPVAPAPEGPR